MKIKKKLIVKNTKNGRGVFANKHFKKGEIIFEFHGNFYTHEELPKPYYDYYVQIGEDLFMGPSGDMDDIFNHSCNPNSWLQINSKKVFLIAMEDIKKGDEIVWDYSTTMYEDDWEMNCNCGSENCRGIIREFKYLPTNIQKKYLDLGIVPVYVLKNFRNKLPLKKNLKLLFSSKKPKRQKN
jgi:hypothetical protein